MSEPLDRLKAALADRYAIEHELGSGGMATVYLAEARTHERKVAAAVSGADRRKAVIEGRRKADMARWRETPVRGNDR